MQRQREVNEFTMLATDDGVPPEVLRWRWSRKGRLTAIFSSTAPAHSHESSFLRRAAAFERVCQLAATRPEHGALILLLDDNFYYRSMRHTYFQLVHSPARERPRPAET